MLKKVILSCLAGMFAIALAMSCIPTPEHPLRARVVKLVGSRGQCSGEQVQAPSGVSYILTAGHCALLVEEGQVKVITEEGKTIMRRLIAEDMASDLLLIEGVPGLEGLDIASSAHEGEMVRTFTHGAGMDTYKTQGELLGDISFSIPIESEKCEGPKYSKGQAVKVDLGGFVLEIPETCMLHLTETFSTAMTVPGSSGGMVVNSAGQLVGVVSVGDGRFSGFVRLTDIQAFLSGY